MKRITLNLSPVLLVEDEADVLDLQQSIVKHLMGLDTVETVICRRADVDVARSSFCVPGDHEFVVESQHTHAETLPTVCRSHWYEGQIKAATDEHQALWDALAEHDMGGYIWQSGGMTMTIQIPLHAEDGEQDDRDYPAYLGLKEGETEDGRWFGSVGFYKTWDEQDDCPQIVTAYDEPLAPAEWAAKIAEHRATLTD